MKYAYLLIYLLMVVQASQAQTPKLDSLNRLINQASSDTARISLINKKIDLLVDVNIDSALALSLKTIGQAKKINFKAGEISARRSLAGCYILKGDYTAAKNNLKIAEDMAISLKEMSRLLKVYNTYGMLYGMQSKYDSSIAFFQKGIPIAEQGTDKSSLEKLYMNIGTSYSMLSNHPEALRYEQKALRLAETNNNYRNQALCLVNMANTYKAMGDELRAEQRYTRAIKLAKQESLKNVELYAYSNMATIYSSQRKSQKAYEFASMAARLSKEMGDQGMEAASLTTAATSLAEQKKFAEAERLGKSAIDIANESRQPLNIHQAYASMGTILKMQNKYAPAISYYEKGFAALKDADIYDSQTGDIYRELSDCYEKTGDFRRALSTYKIAATIADSVRGKENIRKSTELSMNYEFEKKEQAAQIEQQKQNAIAEARQIALLSGLVLMLLLAGVSFYAYRTKHKANTLLEAQKQQLQQQKSQLEEQKVQLEKTLTELQSTQRQLVQAEKMATMGKLTKGIVDRILNPLNYINNFSLAAKDLLREVTDVTQKYQPTFAPNDLDDLEDSSTMLSQNLDKINQHGNSTARILQGMQKLLKERSSTFATLDVNHFLEQHITNSLQKAVAGYTPPLPVELTFHLQPQPLEVTLLTHEFTEVIANLIDNSCYSLSEQQRRQADFKPTIEVSTHQLDDQAEIRIRDNGRGIPPKELAQLFNPFFTTKPTAKGTGLGLYMSKDVVEYLQGHMKIESKEGEYTDVIIHLPLVTAESMV